MDKAHRVIALLWLGWIGLGAGCRAPAPARHAPAPFRFERDTFAFPNSTYWVYRVDPVTGKAEHETRVPRPDYAHHCFVLVRAAKEFHLHARFDPALERISDDAYRERIRAVVRRSSRRRSAESEKVVFPGYADLRSFSADHSRALKDGLGGAWQSYSQRGHWRMLFWFSGTHQARVAEELADALADGAPRALHVVQFPALSINHALLAFGATSGEQEIRIHAYDPNEPAAPLDLVFDRRTRRFTMPATPYFRGGEVDVYEVYRSAWY